VGWGGGVGGLHTNNLVTPTSCWVELGWIGVGL
jgi:hypothetical protein